MSTPAISRTPVALQPERELRTLEGELVSLIADQARRVPLQVVGSALIIALLVASAMPPWFPLLWFVLIVIGTVLHSRCVTRLPQSEGSEQQQLQRAAVSFTLHAILLASILCAFPFVTIPINAVLTIYCIGLAAATLHATAGYPKVFVPYTVATLGPVILVWTLPVHPEVSPLERFTMAGLAVAYLVTMWGHARGTFAVFSDAHRMREERLDLNRQLREALSQAELANAAKTRFLASASHDLRQPIHALTLFSGSLSLRPLDARTAAIAEQIDKAITVLGTQLDALLDISRLDAGVIERNLAPIELPVMLEQLLQEFRPQAERKGLALHLECPADVWVRSDAGLLLRVLRNLLSNAIKYTRQGQVRLSVTRQGAGCQLAVADTGPGIPLSEREHVFEEFYQLENPERDRSKGLGLGLAIVRRLTALLELPLGLVSETGVGSTFTLHFAHALLPEPVAVVPAGPEPRAESIRVLVVDDEEAIRFGMKTLLEALGFEVRLASSTESATLAAEGFEPSIVLADFRLHGEDDGMKAIDQLRRFRPLLPALLISGDTAPDRLLKAHQAGIPLLHKPVTAAHLKASILKAVEVSATA